MSDRYLPLHRAGEATGTAVAIDVLRAFTTAAYAFDQGARRIVMVGGIDEARALRDAHSDWLLMGELDGHKIEGFDFSNSPVEISEANISGRILVQRTSAGTQGVVGARNATRLFCASMVCASATARAIDGEVDFIVTGQGEDDATGYGDEDLACAELINVLRNGPVPPDAHLDRVRHSNDARDLA